MTDDIGSRVPMLAIKSNFQSQPVRDPRLSQIEDHGEAQAREFENALAGLPEIVACWSIAGSSDFMLQVIGRDLDAFAEFAMETIRRLPGIKAMQTTLTLKEVKAPAPWPIPGAIRSHL